MSSGDALFWLAMIFGGWLLFAALVAVLIGLIIEWGADDHARKIDGDRRQP